MKTFTLAGLLRVRLLQETLAAADVAAARRHLDRVRGRRARIGAALAGTRVEASGTAALAAIAASRAGAQSLLNDLVALEALAEQNAQEAAEIHRDARTAARTIGRLQERFDADVHRDELRREQGALDEVALARAARRAAEPPQVRASGGSRR